MSRMAPLCKCGHKASEHSKQIHIRTYCVFEQEHRSQNPLDTKSYSYCSCLMYRPKEEK